MGASGITTINFGAFPGGHDASVAISGQAGILSESLVEAWIMPVATSDHSADEHMVEPIKIIAGNISPGVGFTIYGFNANPVIEKNDDLSKYASAAAGTLRDRLGYKKSQTEMKDNHNTIAPIYGQFTVAWVWN